ncbi:MAG: FG-GAP-like repeat-containing protein [Candidatus Methylomirabilales bacterium]
MNRSIGRLLQTLLLGLSLFILWNTTASATLLCSPAPRSLAVGDFDGDGNLDVALVRQGSQSVAIHRGDGNGGLLSPSNVDTGIEQPTSVVAGDFVGDSNLDLAVVGLFRGIRSVPFFTRVGVAILQGNGSGGFQALPLINLGFGTDLLGSVPTVTAADFNDDGKLDLAVVNANNLIRILLQDAGGGFTGPSATSSVLSGPIDIATGSFNANEDQELDLAVANRFQSPGQISIRFGDGIGDFLSSAPNIETGGIGPQSIDAGDLNGDGSLDLAVAHFGSNDISILLGDGNGEFALSGSPFKLHLGVIGNLQSLVVLDFNGDEKLDLAVATFDSFQNFNKVFVRLGDGNGGFPDANDFKLEFDVGFPPSSIVAGDFTGDDLPDLAVDFFCSGDVKILVNPLPPPGKAMVYVTNREDDTVSVIDPNTNQVIDTVPVGHKPHGITLTPGGKEAYVANRNDNNVSVIQTGTTPGSNTEILTIPVGQKPEGVGSAEVPNKGAKVFVANRNDDTVSVMDADPSSLFFHTVISTVNLPKPKNHKPVAVAFSPDGAFAYVVAEGSDKLFVIDAQKAIDDPANAVLGSVAVGKKPMALDVSSDGKRIYVANRGEDTVSKLTTETPGAPASPQVIATIDVEHHPEGVAILPNGSRLYVTNREANTVSVIDTTTDTVTTTIPVGKHPLGIDILPGGEFAYVAEEGDNSVAAIDTSNNSVVAMIPVGKHPRSVAAGTVSITAP